MAITDIVAPGRRRTGLPTQHQQAPTLTATWHVWGTTASVTVDDPSALNVARRIVSRQFLAAEKAAARFRADAELHKLYKAGGRPVTISPLLAELVSAALAVAERTDGDVDPTVGAAMTANAARRGQDISIVPVCGSRPTGSRPAPGWEQVRLEGRKLQVPAGTTLDLSATAKAAICDMAAARVRERVDAGVLVRLGGNAVSSGPAPDQGWRVPITDRAGHLDSEVFLTANAALSSSQIGVPPRHRDAPVSYLIDPHTGDLPLPVWRMVSAIGFSCLEASAYSTASLVRGIRARNWLTQLWVPARLITVDDDELFCGNWSAHTLPDTPASTLS
ncbi:FAD:protein FMN transferase [Kineosporia sp. J2-2]|uniref:FAD:protein FMN transferase n=1 Tax=Kineosporia corallincola TaxID=2835133 RepID=A0ABS5TJD7_9ACTN|nr:FAD:protein FMN transferase [Kineosporia corallincola]MBT0771212.1 FAD:protein FMN transferase [Kineosporia corallincola]